MSLACVTNRCARPTKGSHARSGGSSAQGFKGANRTAAPKWRKQRGPGRLSRRTSENSPSETVWKFSGTRQPPHHQADHCRVDERFCASTKPLVILAHPPVLREPGEGPFHHPPAG